MLKNMMAVPRLRQICRLRIAEDLVKDGYGCVSVENIHSFVLSQLDQGAWGFESLAILDRAVKYFNCSLSPRVILALLPCNTKSLSMKDCPLLTEECLNAAIERCFLLESLDLTENTSLNFSCVNLFGTVSFERYKTLTAVTLEDCHQVNNVHVQTLLLNAPNLQHLNIARCDITDAVFLLNEQKQLAREAGFQIDGLTSEFDSKLQTVDVSRCDEFTSTGVRHLCTLCGPTLQNINLSWTQVDCTAFLYLSGMGLPHAVQFYLSTSVVNSSVLESLVYTLHQFDAICEDISDNWTSKDHSEEHLDIEAEVISECSLCEKDESQPEVVSLHDIQPVFNCVDVDVNANVPSCSYEKKSPPSVGSNIGMAFSDCKIQYGDSSSTTKYSPSLEESLSCNLCDVDVQTGVEGEIGAENKVPEFFSSTQYFPESPGAVTVQENHSNDRISLSTLSSTTSPVEKEKFQIEEMEKNECDNIIVINVDEANTVDNVIVTDVDEATTVGNVIVTNVDEATTVDNIIVTNVDKATTVDDVIVTNVDETTTVSDGMEYSDIEKHSLHNNSAECDTFEKDPDDIFQLSENEGVVSALGINTIKSTLKEKIDYEENENAQCYDEKFLSSTGELLHLDVSTDLNSSLSEDQCDVSSAPSLETKEVSGPQRGSMGSKIKMDFAPNIRSIQMNGHVFKDENSGILCLQTFLKANENLHSLTLYGGMTGNFVTDLILDMIGHYSHKLMYLSIEGCDQVTNIGATALAKNCHQLSTLDLTGVPFLGDPGIIHLLRSLPLTHLLMAESQITGLSLDVMSAMAYVSELKELDLSWCEEIAGETSLNQLLQLCSSLKRLMLRETPLTANTLSLIAENCCNITELSIASNMANVSDESVCLLTENLLLLENIDLSWNSHLTDKSIHSLFQHCHHLWNANLEGLKRMTSSAFVPIIVVPDELKDFLAKQCKETSSDGKAEEAAIRFEILPCLPHRSTTYCTKLRSVNLKYSDFVEDATLQELVTVTQGGIKVIDYYGEEVEGSKSAVEKLLKRCLNSADVT